MAAQKRWLGKLLLLCCSTIFALLLVEVGLRVMGWANPYFYTFENETGWSMRPNVAGWFRKEGAAYVEINSQGLRDVEHALTRPPDTYRIAVMGDSFSEALQVPLEKTFWHLLEERLKDCQPLVGKKIEVINFGVSSYGTAQELLALRTRAFAYEPDMVVLIFVPANDIRNNSRVLEGDDLRPYFVYQGDELVPDMSFRDAPAHQQKTTSFNNALYDVINHVRLLQLLNSVREARQASQLAGKQPASGAGGELGVDDQAFIPPTDPRWIDAWRVTEGLITQMDRDARAHGARFLVVSGTYGPQVQPFAAARTAFALRLELDDLLYPGRRVVELGAREGFPVVDLVPPFQAYAEKYQTPLHGFGPKTNQGHWNEAGHELAAELITQQACTSLQ